MGWWSRHIGPWPGSPRWWDEIAEVADGLAGMAAGPGLLPPPDISGVHWPARRALDGLDIDATPSRAWPYDDRIQAALDAMEAVRSMPSQPMSAPRAPPSASRQAEIDAAVREALRQFQPHEPLFAAHVQIGLPGLVLTAWREAHP